MAKHLSIKLLRLIRERSYAAGELPALEKAVAEGTAALRLARKNLRAKKKRIAELDAQISALAPSIDPDDIRAQRRTERLDDTPHGSLTATFVDIIREAGPAGLGWTEINRQMLLAFPMDVSTEDLRQKARKRFRDVLRSLRARGAVMKVGTEPGLQGTTAARWAWTGRD